MGLMAIELDEISQIKGISIVHMNVRSLMNKFSEVKLCLTRSSPDVLLLSETWTQPELPMSLFSVPNYNHWRFDRQTVRDNGLRKQGGGLCIYVPEKYISTEELNGANISCVDIELFWIQMNIRQTRPIIIGAMYRPPSGSIGNALEILTKSLEIIYNVKNPEAFLLGDLNRN